MHPLFSSSLLLLLPACLGLQSVTIGAFNIRTFGQKKSQNETLMNIINEIMLHYDVLLIQEIRDKSQNTLERLYKKVNTVSGVQFNYIRSDRLGRSSNKEQYAYYYRSDKVDIVGSHQYNDSGDLFEREPFSVLVRVPLPNGDPFHIALVAHHAKPDTAVAEIDQLDEVYEEVKAKLFTRNVVLMGDMNADCNYANVEELSGTEVFSSSTFQSLIGHDADTTTYTTTDCAYDRIIGTGNALLSKTLTAEVDRFDIDLNLDNTLTKAVSDHYPVKLTIKF